MTKPLVYKMLLGKVKQLGYPEADHPMDRVWETGMFKAETDNEIWLGKTGLAGDEVADTKNHGGPEKAIFAYPLSHYEDWRKELQIDAIDIGFMGENLAVLGMDESTVSIGDTYQFGEAVIQVSQPRRPCWKPARRLRMMDFALRIQKTGRTGWYFRVLQEGNVRGGLTLELIDRPYPEWTIAACNDVMYVDVNNLKRTEKLATCDLLAANWKQSLHKRLQGQVSATEERVFGPNRGEHG